MFCISIRQPWSECIVRGVKSIEVRTWLPPSKLIGEMVAIHAGKKWSREAPLEIHRLAGNAAYETKWQIARSGGIIGVAKLVKAFRFSYAEFKEMQSKHLNPLNWYGDGLCGWEFAEPVRFERMIPCKGQLRFWELDEATEGRVKAALL
jgi:hypothetical protein